MLPGRPLSWVSACCISLSADVSSKGGQAGSAGKKRRRRREEKGRTGVKNEGKRTMNREMREEVTDPKRRSNVTAPNPSPPHPLLHPFLGQRSLFPDANCSFISSHCICLASSRWCLLLAAWCLPCVAAVDIVGGRNCHVCSRILFMAWGRTFKSGTVVSAQELRLKCVTSQMPVFAVELQRMSRSLGRG